MSEPTSPIEKKCPKDQLESSQSQLPYTKQALEKEIIIDVGERMCASLGDGVSPNHCVSSYQTQSPEGSQDIVERKRKALNEFQKNEKDKEASSLSYREKTPICLRCIPGCSPFPPQKMLPFSFVVFYACIIPFFTLFVIKDSSYTTNSAKTFPGTVEEIVSASDDSSYTASSIRGGHSHSLFSGLAMPYLFAAILEMGSVAFACLIHYVLVMYIFGYKVRKEILKKDKQHSCVRSPVCLCLRNIPWRLSFNFVLIILLLGLAFWTIYDTESLREYQGRASSELLTSYVLRIQRIFTESNMPTDLEINGQSAGLHTFSEDAGGDTNMQQLTNAFSMNFNHYITLIVCLFVEVIFGVISIVIVYAKVVLNGTTSTIVHPRSEKEASKKEIDSGDPSSELLEMMAVADSEELSSTRATDRICRSVRSAQIDTAVVESADDSATSSVTFENQDQNGSSGNARCLSSKNSNKNDNKRKGSRMKGFHDYITDHAEKLNKKALQQSQVYTSSSQFFLGVSRVDPIIDEEQIEEGTREPRSTNQIKSCGCGYCIVHNVKITINPHFMVLFCFAFVFLVSLIVFVCQPNVIYETAPGKGAVISQAFNSALQLAAPVALRSMAELIPKSTMFDGSKNQNRYKEAVKWVRDHSYLEDNEMWLDEREYPEYPLVHGTIEEYCLLNSWNTQKCDGVHSTTSTVASENDVSLKNITGTNGTSFENEKRATRTGKSRSPNLVVLIWESFSPLGRYTPADFIHESYEHTSSIWRTGQLRGNLLLNKNPYDKTILPNLRNLSENGITLTGLASMSLPTLKGWQALASSLPNGGMLNMVDGVYVQANSMASHFKSMGYHTLYISPSSFTFDGKINWLFRKSAVEEAAWKMEKTNEDLHHGDILEFYLTGAVAHPHTTIPENFKNGHTSKQAPTTFYDWSSESRNNSIMKTMKKLVQKNINSGVDHLKWFDFVGWATPANEEEAMDYLSYLDDGSGSYTGGELPENPTTWTCDRLTTAQLHKWLDEFSRSVLYEDNPEAEIPEHESHEPIFGMYANVETHYPWNGYDDLKYYADSIDDLHFDENNELIDSENWEYPLTRDYDRTLNYADKYFIGQTIDYLRNWDEETVVVVVGDHGARTVPGSVDFDIWGTDDEGDSYAYKRREELYGRSFDHDRMFTTTAVITYLGDNPEVQKLLYGDNNALKGKSIGLPTDHTDLDRTVRYLASELRKIRLDDVPLDSAVKPTPSSARGRNLLKLAQDVLSLDLGNLSQEDFLNRWDQYRSITMTETNIEYRGFSWVFRSHGYTDVDSALFSMFPSGLSELHSPTAIPLAYPSALKRADTEDVPGDHGGVSEVNCDLFHEAYYLLDFERHILSNNKLFNYDFVYVLGNGTLSGVTMSSPDELKDYISAPIPRRSGSTATIWIGLLIMVAAGVLCATIMLGIWWGVLATRRFRARKQMESKNCSTDHSVASPGENHVLSAPLSPLNELEHQENNFENPPRIVSSPMGQFKLSPSVSSV